MSRGICLVGAGRIGAIHAANIVSLAGVRLCCVVDSNADAARDLAGRYGVEALDLALALGRDDVDAVVVASSTDTHVPVMTAAGEAGKAIFCEKPVDLDLARARACIEHLEAGGVPLALGFNRRYDPSFARLQQRLRAGEIGEVEIVSITSRDPAPPPLDYLRRSGGLFMDMMIHDFDMACWLLGEAPVQVHATASCLVDEGIAALGDVDTALVTLRTASGRLCQISNSRRAVYGYDQRVEVHGAAGMLRAENREETSVQLFGAGGVLADPPMDFFLERYAQAYREEMREFVNALEGLPARLVSGRDGLLAQSLAEAAATSLREQRTVDLPAA
ncbi:inositol 2-dehydrogenase [Parahaliea mediterranea]|uniref:Inositol 2-dehydrogenase n=1 Tax=Parahaliea mediterranea TaxID=651086 RepID=A0A939DEG0_9GAMM|nr:inositol 2-dehydrogenase [Parahaliea mediterranea]MBN7796391.1 inositol 2-dehydrogenase [Parahaliea mediterranea]